VINKIDPEDEIIQNLRQQIELLQQQVEILQKQIDQQNEVIQRYGGELDAIRYHTLTHAHHDEGDTCCR